MSYFSHRNALPLRRGAFIAVGSTAERSMPVPYLSIEISRHSVIRYLPQPKVAPWFLAATGGLWYDGAIQRKGILDFCF